MQTRKKSSKSWQRHNITSNSVRDVLKEAIGRLSEAGCDTPQLDAELLLSRTLHEERSWLYLHPKDSLNPWQLETFTELIARRENREPVAYIVGHKEFFALDFLVNRHVLIPRPETELLVETTIEIINNSNDKNVLIADIGTGSGCIAISLAKHLPDAVVLAGDISCQALQLAEQNARCNEVAHRVLFFVGDLMAPLAAQVDMIVSNPPYISHSEMMTSSVTPKVQQYEPRLALDGGHDGLAIIGRLLSQAVGKLNPNGSLLAEIGFEQGQAVTELAKAHFPRANIQIKKDLAGLDRLLIIRN